MASQHQKYYPNQNLNRKETAIIGYIKEFENEPKRLTINQIASAMDKSGICSRLTTNKIINNLINLNIIIDEKRGNKFHRLKINKDYWLNPHKLEDELLKSKIQKALEPLKPLLISKKMEVQLVNKVKGETDIIIGIEATAPVQNQVSYIEERIARLAKNLVTLKAAVRKDKGKFTPKQIEEMQSTIQRIPSILKELEKEEEIILDQQKKSKKQLKAT